MKIAKLSIATLIASASALFAVTTASAVEKTPALTVLVAPVTQQSLNRKIVATGNVVAWREMPISAEASGLAVTAVEVDEGDAVTQGQTLARLNDSILNAQVAQQKAAIAELEATLANAQSDVRRARSVAAGVVSAQTTEQRETLVRTVTAKIEAARATLDEVGAKLKQTEILATAAGLVSSRSVTLGQVVQTGTEMFRIIQDHRIEVDALVPESDLLEVKPGQAAGVYGPAGGVQQGTIRLVAPVVDAKTRLGTVHISLPQDTTLMPGMFARIEIETSAKSAMAVPLKALVWRQSKAGVFKVTAEGTVAFTEVVIGGKTSEVAEVTGGLKNDDRIVVEGAGLLNDGDTVNVRLASVQGVAQ